MSQNGCKERSRQHQDLVLVSLTHVRRLRAAICHSVYLADGTKQRKAAPVAGYWVARRSEVSRESSAFQKQSWENKPGTKGTHGDDPILLYGSLTLEMCSNVSIGQALNKTAAFFWEERWEVFWAEGGKKKVIACSYIMSEKMWLNKESKWSFLFWWL